MFCAHCFNTWRIFAEVQTAGQRNQDNPYGTTADACTTVCQLTFKLQWVPDGDIPYNCDGNQVVCRNEQHPQSKHHQDCTRRPGTYSRQSVDTVSRHGRHVFHLWETYKFAVWCGHHYLQTRNLAISIFLLCYLGHFNCCVHCHLSVLT